MAKYKYASHEERGEFHAYVEDSNGNVVWEVHYPDLYEDEESGELVECSTIFDDGYMKNVDDIEGLEDYLKSIGILHSGDELVSENSYAEGGSFDGSTTYEKVRVTIKDVDMGGDVAYKGDHWFRKSQLDTKTNKQLGDFILKKYGLDYGNTYKYSIVRTGETKEKMARGGEVEDEVYNAYVIWIDDNEEAFFDGGWNSIEDAEDRVSDIYFEEDRKPKYEVFAVEYDENYFENKNWDITRLKSYRPYGDTNDKKVVELTPIYTLRDKQGFRFYSTEDGNKLYAEKNGDIYEVNNDTLKPSFIIPLWRSRFNFVGLIDDNDVKSLHPLHYEREGIKRVRKSFGMARGGALKYYDEENEYRLSRPSSSIEKDILEKVIFKESTSENNFVGNFGWKTPQGKLADGYIYNLDEYDQNLVKDIKLKEGERIFRYFNRTTAISGSTPMIKINLDKELLYFTIDNENDEIVFERKGTEALWIALIQYKMASGGALETKLKKRLSESFELPMEMAIYVPSTDKANVIISKKEYQNRVEEVERYLSDLFGGYSAVSVDGGYVSDEKGLIQEDVTRVATFGSTENFESKFTKIVNKVVDWCNNWGQESMGFEFEGDMFYIDKKASFEHGGVMAKGGVMFKFPNVYVNNDDKDKKEYKPKASTMIYKFNVYLYNDDEDKTIKEKKEYKVRASSRNSAYDKANKKFPKPYFVELNSVDKMAKGGEHKVDKNYAYFGINKKTNKIVMGWEIVDDVESLKYYAKIDFEDNDLNPKDYNILSAKTLKSRGIDPYSWDSWAKTGEYAKGGEMANGTTNN